MSYDYIKLKGEVSVSPWEMQLRLVPETSIIARAYWTWHIRHRGVLSGNKAQQQKPRNVPSRLTVGEVEKSPQRFESTDNQLNCHCAAVLQSAGGAEWCGEMKSAPAEEEWRFPDTQLHYELVGLAGRDREQSRLRRRCKNLVVSCHHQALQGDYTAGTITHTEWSCVPDLFTLSRMRMFTQASNPDQVKQFPLSHVYSKNFLLIFSLNNAIGVSCSWEPISIWASDQ